MYRRASDVERRRTEAALSEAGRRLLAQADAIAAGHEARARAALSDDLRRLADAIGTRAAR